MHRILSGAELIIAVKKSINKQLRKHIKSAFKLSYSQIDAYHKKSNYFSGTKTFCVIQSNSLPFLENVLTNSIKEKMLKTQKLVFLHYTQKFKKTGYHFFY